MLKMLDLFSGIGGFSYAGEKLVGGYETVAFCEYDEHAQKVLRKHWPHTEIIKDVRELAKDADRFRGMVDIITGGYPCQPFSYAGVRKGDKDDRHLWPEMLAVIKKVRPNWVIGENVAGHITMGLDEVLSDLEAANYTAQAFVIPAVATDAPHRRDRVWIIAHTNSQGEPVSTVNEQRVERSEVMGNANSGNSEGIVSGKPKQKERGSGFAAGRKDVSNADSAHPQRGWISSGIQPQHTQFDGRGNQSGWQVSQFWEPEPAVGRVAYGVPGRVHRLKQLGNSIVPQVAAKILASIKQIEGG